MACMNVYILRHAKADFGSKGEDPPVSEQGEKQTTHVLELARKNMGFDPSLVVTSPILRARQTADIVRKEVGSGVRVAVDDCLMPEAKPKEVLKYLSKLKKDEDVVLISHMPLIFELLYDLIGGRGEIELLNGSMAAVHFEGRASSHKGKLVWLIQPKA